MKHALVLLFVLVSSTFAYEAMQGPTELLYWDKTNAFSGYTWFGVRGTTYLLDMGGAWFTHGPSARIRTC